MEISCCREACTRHVVGDGVHTITELVDVVNQDHVGLGMKRFH